MATFNKFRHLFDLSLKVTKHRRDSLGRDYTQNAFRSRSGAAIEVTRLVVEMRPGYEELKEIIRQHPKVSNPKSRVYCHLKNMLYYASPDIAPQWGLPTTLGIKNDEEMPPCFVLTIKGKEYVLKDDFDDNNINLILRAEKITSPLLERLSEMAKSSSSL